MLIIGVYKKLKDMILISDMASKLEWLSHTQKQPCALQAVSWEKKCGIRTLTDPMRLLCSFDWDNFLHPISLFTLNTSVLLVNTGNCVHIFFIYFIFFWDDYPAHQVYQDQWKSVHIANIYIYFHSHFMGGKIKSMRLELLPSYTNSIHKN